MERRHHWIGAALVALAVVGAGRPSAGTVSDPVRVAPLGPRHPARLAERLERIEPDGRWVDLHAPLTPQELAPLAAHRAPRPASDELQGPPARRASAYVCAHPPRRPWPPRRP